MPAGILRLTVLFLLLPVALPAAETSRDYVIGSKDVIDIKVYEQPDLSQVIRVSEEGFITMPLIGDVKAVGMTVEKLTKVITEKYTEYIVQPQITLYVREYHSKEIYLLGEVNRPGVYQLTGNATLLELLTQAGGITQAGGETMTVIHRPKPGQEAETAVINLTRLLEGGDGRENVVVLDGDTIYVPKANYFFVFGEVQKPGSYKLEKGLKLTILKAISLAGGFTDKAAKGKVKITREADGKQVTFKADMNTEVLPHDIIIVPESFF